MKKSSRQLLMKIYGGRADVHLDLYRLSNQHRRKHGQDCELYPSDPLQAPLWGVVASLTHARRILEVGCGQGYTAANMASAAGPDCRVDTIEENPQHAALAEEAFQLRDLSNRINVLRGRGQSILPRLKGRYDLVFLDGDWREYPSYIPHLRRLIGTSLDQRACERRRIGQRHGIVYILHPDERVLEIDSPNLSPTGRVFFFSESPRSRSACNTRA